MRAGESDLRSWSNLKKPIYFMPSLTFQFQPDFSKTRPFQAMHIYNSGILSFAQCRNFVRASAPILSVPVCCLRVLRRKEIAPWHSMSI